MESEDDYKHKSYKKKSKKHKEKKKHKSKKLKHRSSDSSDGDANNVEWVEKSPDKEEIEEVSKKTLSKRDDWMTNDFDFQMFSRDDGKKEIKTKKSEEDIKNKYILDEPGQNERELNPYWKNGGTGLPEDKRNDLRLPSSSVGDQGLDWLKRGLRRAEEQAKEEGRSLELVAAERWGSLNKLLSLIKEAEEKNSKKWEYRKKESFRYGSRKNQDYNQDKYKNKLKFQKPSSDNTYTSSHSSNYSHSNSKKNWQKKTVDIEDSPPPHSETSPTCSKNLNEKSTRCETMTKKKIEKQDSCLLTDKEMNDLGAKIVKAEIMGDEELLEELKNKMELARNARASGEKHKIEPIEEETKEIISETIILSRTDNRGFTRPVQSQTLPGSSSEKRKNKKIETHDSGKRVRYFADDDKYSLQEMFVQEKMSTTDDHLEQFVKLAGKTKPDHDYDVDDSFTEKMNVEEKAGKVEARERDRAIAEHRRKAKALDGCHYCLESAPKHLVVAVGQNVYLSVPSHQSLTEGHCLIIPIHHVPCSTQLDEDVWEEIQVYRKKLVEMFSSLEKDLVIFESALSLRKFPHMILECVPLNLDNGALAPIYFKKAILECEKEWSNNKKLVEMSQEKNVRRVIPKGLPYFAVNFGSDNGFAHVVEDEDYFPKNFAQEILGGMMDLDHRIWRKNRKENFDNQRSKMLKLAKWFSPFDPYKKKRELEDE